MESAAEMPILEYGRDAASILTTAINSLHARLPPPLNNEEEEEVVAALGRRMAPSFTQHIDALEEFYFTKFQDRFVGTFTHPPTYLVYQISPFNPTHPPTHPP